ncbi:MAG TPA: hypothetical protein VFU82_04435 [Gammaproteobacteria bacterium]|jgi:hypothetical protein|nr:hypothetical protein [Gammaproteobacteria bacterium]
MKMKLCVGSLLLALSTSSVWADAQPGVPTPGAPGASAPASDATNGAIVDQGGSLRYQSQVPAGSQPASPMQPPMGGAPQSQPRPQSQPMAPNAPGMSATQPTPPAQ